MTLPGLPLELWEYPAVTRTNRRFRDTSLTAWDRIFLPGALRDLLPEPPLGPRRFIEDDNRSAIVPEPVAELDGLPFYLSVKGVGSSIDPYSWRPLDRWYGAELSRDPEVRTALRRRPPGADDRLITGERWLRGSPYGGQGAEHAEIALALSERADLTSLAGFRIAPVVKVAELPTRLSDQLRSIRWYRAYPGRFVQELRLVPSNVRVYFHARTTVGTAIGEVFDRFGLVREELATAFQARFLASAAPLLTLFARTMRAGPDGSDCRGIDFLDVWLDKDAVLAPDGTAYFVDLEGLEEVAVPRSAVREKLEDQIFRSLYEVTFAYEQIEAERVRRFGAPEPRRERFLRLFRRAVAADPFLRLREDGPSVALEVRTKVDEPTLHLDFPLLDP